MIDLLVHFDRESISLGINYKDKILKLKNLFKLIYFHCTCTYFKSRFNL